MPSITDVFTSDETLRAADLPEGVPVPVIIETATPVFFDDGAKMKLGFRGKRKILICNRTNSLRIAELLGQDYSLWIGKSIFIQRAVTEFRGAVVPCVRVALSPPATPAARMAPPEPAAMPTATVARDYGPDDEIPF
ncbi:MAG: hypothetical protein C0485_04330 [Pirellula sp.]|nr:hypothetical protein [Pirellula sp.]